MRTLEVRRHTMRRKPGAHLSLGGIELARLVAQGMGPFSLVVTSKIPRAAETAVAMGFEVGETLEELGHLPDEVLNEIGWPTSLDDVAKILARKGPSARFAKAQAKLWRSIAGKVPDGQHVLVITHGGFIEVGAVASLPEADFDAWGGAIGYCEGVRLVYDGDNVRGEVLRVAAEHQLIEN